MGEPKILSVDNGIGTGARLYAVDELPVETQKLPTDGRLYSADASVGEAPKAKKSRRSVNWRELSSTFVELLGIGSFSAGFGWFSPGLGMIFGGVSLVAMGVTLARPPVRNSS